MSDTELERFVTAQDGTYEDALAQLHRGRKTGHWMWYVFPQVEGLGFSAMAQRYAIGSLDEARAYAAHPVLGERLRACARALLQHDGVPAVRILGDIDAMKLRSSMTLFRLAVPDEPLFEAVLDRYFQGEPDEQTVRRV